MLVSLKQSYMAVFSRQLRNGKNINSLQMLALLNTTDIGATLTEVYGK